MRVAVCVPSHDRPLRLRWLLNALEEQTRRPDEVVVVHDSRGTATDRLLAEHPLRPTAIRVAPCGPGAKRDVAWRAARADLVVFTDDDCRPPAAWLERVVAAAEAAPGAIVQGATRPDPDELGLVALHGWRSQHIDPPTPWGQTCNIAYPRAVLEAAGGFDGAVPVASGEDADLLARARAHAPLVAAPDALTWHAVEVLPLPARVRQVQRWRHVALVVRRHPRLRRHLPLGLFYTPRHAWLCAAALAAAARRPLALAAALAGYARAAAPSYGPHPRGRARALAELPLCAIQDAAEVAALARGSVEHRTPLL